MSTESAQQTSVTALLRRAGDGDSAATSELFPLVYEELKRLAERHFRNERAGHTLQATVLVHEAYLRLVGADDPAWHSRSHFFAAAATAMRRILTDHARRRKRLKRGGDREKLSDLESGARLNTAQDIDLVALDEALTRLAQLDPVKVRVIELRYFTGLTLEQTADALSLSVPTISRHWEFARVWLSHELSGEERA